MKKDGKEWRNGEQRDGKREENTDEMENEGTVEGCEAG